MTRPFNRFADPIDLNLLGQATVGNNHNWVGDSNTPDGTPSLTGESIAYQEGDIVVHAEHIFIAGRDNDNVMPLENPTTPFDENEPMSHPWILISGGGATGNLDVNSSDPVTDDLENISDGTNVYGVPTTTVNPVTGTTDIESITVTNAAGSTTYELPPTGLTINELGNVYSITSITTTDILNETFYRINFGPRPNVPGDTAIAATEAFAQEYGIDTSLVVDPAAAPMVDTFYIDSGGNRYNFRGITLVYDNFDQTTLGRLFPTYLDVDDADNAVLARMFAAFGTSGDTLIRDDITQVTSLRAGTNITIDANAAQAEATINSSGASGTGLFVEGIHETLTTTGVTVNSNVVVLTFDTLANAEAFAQYLDILGDHAVGQVVLTTSKTITTGSGFNITIPAGTSISHTAGSMDVRLSYVSPFSSITNEQPDIWVTALATGFDTTVNATNLDEDLDSSTLSGTASGSVTWVDRGSTGQVTHLRIVFSGSTEPPTFGGLHLTFTTTGGGTTENYGFVRESVEFRSAASPTDIEWFIPTDRVFGSEIRATIAPAETVQVTYSRGETYDARPLTTGRVDWIRNGTRLVFNEVLGQNFVPIPSAIYSISYNGLTFTFAGGNLFRNTANLETWEVEGEHVQGQGSRDDEPSGLGFVTTSFNYTIPTGLYIEFTNNSAGQTLLRELFNLSDTDPLPTVDTRRELPHAVTLDYTTAVVPPQTSAISPAPITIAAGAEVTLIESTSTLYELRFTNIGFTFPQGMTYNPGTARFRASPDRTFEINSARVDTLAAGNGIRIDVIDHTATITAGQGAGVIANVPTDPNDPDLTSLRVDGVTYDVSGGGGGGATSILDLSDTPDSFPAPESSDTQLQVLRYNNESGSEAGLEFVDVFDHIEEAEPETLDFGLEGISSEDAGAQPEVLRFHPPTSWQEFGRIPSISLGGIPDFQDGFFTREDLEGEWTALPNERAGMLIEGPTINQNGTNVVIPNFVAADSSGRTGLIYRRQLANNRYGFLIPVSPDVRRGVQFRGVNRSGILTSAGWGGGNSPNKVRWMFVGRNGNGGFQRILENQVQYFTDFEVNGGSWLFTIAFRSGVHPVPDTAYRYTVLDGDNSEFTFQGADVTVGQGHFGSTWIISHPTSANFGSNNPPRNNFLLERAQPQDVANGPKLGHFDAQEGWWIMTSSWVEYGNPTRNTRFHITVPSDVQVEDLAANNTVDPFESDRGFHPQYIPASDEGGDLTGVGDNLYPQVAIKQFARAETDSGTADRTAVFNTWVDQDKAGDIVDELNNVYSIPLYPDEVTAPSNFTSTLETFSAEILPRRVAGTSTTDGPLRRITYRGVVNPPNVARMPHSGRRWGRLNNVTTNADEYLDLYRNSEMNLPRFTTDIRNNISQALHDTRNGGSVTHISATDIQYGIQQNYSSNSDTDPASAGTLSLHIRWNHGGSALSNLYNLDRVRASDEHSYPFEAGSESRKFILTDVAWQRTSTSPIQYLNVLVALTNRSAHVDNGHQDWIIEFDIVTAWVSRLGSNLTPVPTPFTEGNYARAIVGNSTTERVGTIIDQAEFARGRMVGGNLHSDSISRDPSRQFNGMGIFVARYEGFLNKANDLITENNTTSAFRHTVFREPLPLPQWRNINVLGNESDTGATRHRGLIADAANTAINPLSAASVTRTVHGLASIQPLLDQIGSNLVDRLNDDTTYPRNNGVSYAKAAPEQWFYSVHRVSSPATATFSLNPGLSPDAGDFATISVDYTGPANQRISVGADSGQWIFANGTLERLIIQVDGINQDPPNDSTFYFTYEGVEYSFSGLNVANTDGTNVGDTQWDIAIANVNGTMDNLTEDDDSGLFEITLTEQTAGVVRTGFGRTAVQAGTTALAAMQAVAAEINAVSDTVGYTASVSTVVSPQGVPTIVFTVTSVIQQKGITIDIINSSTDENGQNPLNFRLGGQQNFFPITSEGTGDPNGGYILDISVSDGQAIANGSVYQDIYVEPFQFIGEDTSGNDLYEAYNTVNGASTQVSVVAPSQNIIDNPGISDTAYIQPGEGNTIIDILEVTYTPPVLGDILDYTPGNSYAANTYVLADAAELPTNYSEVIGDNNPQWLYRSSTALAGGQMLEPRDNPNVWTLITNVYRAPLANLFDAIDTDGLARRGLWNSVAYQAILNIFQSQAMQTFNPEPFGTSWDITNTADTFGDGGFTLRSSVPNRHRVAASSRIITGRTGLINANNSRSPRATLSYLPGTPNVNTGQAGFGALGAASLQQLADVNFPDTPTQGDVLAFNEVNNRWENTPGAGRLDLIDITQRDNSNFVDLDVADPNQNIEINDVLELGGSSQVTNVVFNNELTSVQSGRSVTFRIEGLTPDNPVGFLEAIFQYSVWVNPTTNTDDSAFLQVAGRPADPSIISTTFSRRTAINRLANIINGHLDDLADNNMIARSDYLVFVENATTHSQVEIRYVGTPATAPPEPIRFRIGTTPNITQPIIDNGFYQFNGGYRLVLPSGTTRDSGFAFLPLQNQAATNVQVDWTISPTVEVTRTAFDGTATTTVTRLDSFPTLTYNSTTTVQATEAATQLTQLVNNNSLLTDAGYMARAQGTGVELTGPLGQAFVLDTIIDSGNSATDTQTTSTQASTRANFNLRPTFRGSPLAAISFGDFAPGALVQVNESQTGFEERFPSLLTTENRRLGIVPILDGDEQQIYRGITSVSLIEASDFPSPNPSPQIYTEGEGSAVIRFEYNQGLRAADQNNPPADSFTWVSNANNTTTTTVLDLSSLAADHPIRRFVAMRQEGTFALFYSTAQAVGAFVNDFIFLVRITDQNIVRFTDTVSNFELEVMRIWDASSGTDVGLFGRNASFAFTVAPGEIRLIEPIVAGELFSDDALTELTPNEDYILRIDAAGDASWTEAPAAPADWAEANNTDTIPDNKINSNITRDTEVALTVAGDGTVSLNSNAEEGDVRTAIGAGTLDNGTQVITAINANNVTGRIDADHLDSDLAQSSDIAVTSVTESDGSNSSLLELSSTGVLSNRPIEMRDLPNIQYGDVVIFDSVSDRNASTAHQWHRGDIAIITDPDPDQVYLYVGDPQTSAGTSESTDWHLITPTSGAVTSGQLNNFALTTTPLLGDVLLRAINANADASGTNTAPTVTLDEDAIDSTIARTSQLPTGTITFTGDVTGSITPAATANSVELDVPNLLTLGTTAGTALAGNTPLLQLGTTATTALAGNTVIPQVGQRWYSDTGTEAVTALDRIGTTDKYIIGPTLTERTFFSYNSDVVTDLTHRGSANTATIGLRTGQTGIPGLYEIAFRAQAPNAGAMGISFIYPGNELPLASHPIEATQSYGAAGGVSLIVTVPMFDGAAQPNGFYFVAIDPLGNPGIFSAISLTFKRIA